MEDGSERACSSPTTTAYQRMICAAEERMANTEVLPDVALSAQAAGIDEAAALSMFPTPAALRTAVRDAMLVRLTAAATAGVTAADPSDAPAQIRGLMDGIASYLASDRAACTIMMQQDMHLPVQEHELRYGASLEHLGQALLTRVEVAGQLNPAVSPREAAELARTLLMGLIFQSVARPPGGGGPGIEGRLQTANLAQVDMFLRTILLPGPGSAG